MTSLESIPATYPTYRTCPYGPPSEYAGLRGRPVRAGLPNGSWLWLVTRHEDMRAVLADPRFSADPESPGFPNTGPVGTPDPERVPGMFINMDPPEHGRFRKVLIPEFSVRRIKAMRTDIQRIVDERVDAMLAGGNSADLVAEFALPVPSLVICGLLGVPYADHDYFESRTKIVVSGSSTPQERDGASEEIGRYVTELVAAKRQRPGDDLISRMLATEVMSDDELAGVGTVLLIAGHETTANMISLGVVSLLENPGWASDPRAVEEALRYHSIADLVSTRVAVADVEVGGQLIRAGEGIAALGAAANHDPDAFERPDEFDPARPSRHHVAFGYGVHQCIGQNLARLELEIAYRTLFERIPGLRLALPAEELPYRYDGFLFGLHALPVRF